MSTYILTDDERDGVLWAIRLALKHDDGFAFPRDQNREILRSAQARFACPVDVTPTYDPDKEKT